MSGADGPLRNSDVERLRGAALVLQRGGRFIVVVAATGVWPAAKALLARELAPPAFHEVRLTTGEDVMRMFASAAAATEGIVVLHVGDDAGEAIQTLNLHRDKLRMQACRFVLRLDGATVQERFAREAPDCYSVRDAVVFVEGQAPPPAFRPDLKKLERLRRGVAATDDPKEILDLANGLLRLDHPEEAHREFDRGIALLESREDLSPEERSTLADLHACHRFRASPEEQRDHVRRALRVLEPVRGELAEQYMATLGHLRDAAGIDVTAARSALALARRSAADDRRIWAQLLLLASALCEHGDIKAARAAFEEVPPAARVSSSRRQQVGWVDAHLLWHEGRWEELERRLRTSIGAAFESGEEDWFAGLSADLARLLSDRGELEAAMEILAPLVDDRAAFLRARIRRDRAEPQAIEALTGPLGADMPGPTALSDTIDEADVTSRHVRTAIEAGLLPPDRGAQLDAEIAALSAHVAAVAPMDPPWSRIRMELLVADDLLRRESAEDRARAAAERALSLARTGAAELIPACARRIAVARLRTGQLDELDDLLGDALAACEAHHLPGEAAHVSALRFWQAAAAGKDTADAERALETAIQRTGSVLIEAEALHQAGRGAGRPDLLERSRRIYRSLPWPAWEAQCLEAQGKKAAALARCNAFGLRLAALALERRDRPPPIGA